MVGLKELVTGLLTSRPKWDPKSLCIYDLSFSGVFYFGIIVNMGKRNYLVEGVSGTGKSSVCDELQKRGYQAINGDKELAYQGNPSTGQSTYGFTHEHHIWDINKLKSIAEDDSHEATFFCGGSRNFNKFIDLFDKVFVLEVDVNTLNDRLDSRPDNAWGRNPDQRELILKLHASKEDIPAGGVVIDATVPLEQVVDEIINQTQLEQ